MIPGRAWIQGDGLAWAPAARWRAMGARELLFPIDKIRAISATNLRRGSLGVVVSLEDEGCAWLWVAGDSPVQLIQGLSQPFAERT
jgi:hypothetical protein